MCHGAPKEANAWVGLEPEVPWEKDMTIDHDDPVPIPAVLGFSFAAQFSFFRPNCALYTGSCRHPAENS